MDEILQDIFGDRGFDVRDYKVSVLQRRISRRMDVLKIPGLAEYSDYLRANPDEYEALLNTILVNVTQFFRDPQTWNFLRENVLSDILEKSDGIRIWSAGCSSGEEPYSVAVTLAEMLGDDLPKYTVKIYATDIDEPALRFARSGKYTLDQLAGTSEDMRAKYFTRSGEIYNIAKEIRRLVIFSRHNLLSDPPISHIDLLLCRNVLMYFDHVLQSRIISRLQYALNDAGYLWLGKGEMLIADTHGLKPLDTKWRIFRKMPSPIYLRHDSINHAISYTKTDLINAHQEPESSAQDIRISFIMLDEDFNIVTCDHAIHEICGLQPEQLLRKPFFDLNISHSPVDLRRRIEEIAASKEPLAIGSEECWITKDRRIYLRIGIVPVASGIMLLLEDVTEQCELTRELQITNRVLESNNERLLSENTGLKTAYRQLQSINEELQCANEELESVNEDIVATGREQNSRIAELNESDQHYETVLNSVDLAIVATDRDLLVKTWNGAAARMFGRGEDEVIGRSLVSLNIGLSLKHLADQLQDAIEMGKPATDKLEYVDRWGEKAIVDVSIIPLISEGPSLDEVNGLLLIVRRRD